MNPFLFKDITNYWWYTEYVKISYGGKPAEKVENHCFTSLIHLVMGVWYLRTNNTIIIISETLVSVYY
jgi:hypothetical protein